MSRYPHTYRSGDFLNMSFWLAFNAEGDIKLTRGQPDLARGQRAMSVTLKVPLSLFSRPTLTATITLDDPGVPVLEIDAAAASAAIKEALGVDIDLIVNHPQPEGD